MDVATTYRMRSLVALITMLLAAFLATACKPDSKIDDANTKPTVSRTRPEPSSPNHNMSAEAKMHPIATASGAFVVFYRIIAPSDSVPLNEMFALDVRVEDAEGRPLNHIDIGLNVDAGMPQHGHGMNTTPKTESTGQGYHVSGMLFHMPGDWKIYFDITRDGATDRATVEVALD